MQKWMEKERQPSSKNTTSSVAFTLEVFVLLDGGVITGWRAAKWQGNVTPIVTKKCQLAESVYLSNGKIRVRANVYRAKIPQSMIADIAKRFQNE